MEIVEPRKTEPPPEFKTLAEIEREVITSVLEFYAPMQAAKVLGIGKTTFYRRMTRYGLATPLQEYRRQAVARRAR